MNMKNSGTAYLFWIIWLHRFYLGQPFKGLLYLATMGGFGIWALIDLFQMPHLVRQYNQTHVKELTQLERFYRTYGQN